MTEDRELDTVDGMHVDSDKNDKFHVIGLIERTEIDGKTGFDMFSPRLELKALRGANHNFLECRVYGPEFRAKDAREKSPDWDTARTVEQAPVPNGADCDTWVKVANALIDDTLAESSETVDRGANAWGGPIEALESRVIERIIGR